MPELRKQPVNPIILNPFCFAFLMQHVDQDSAIITFRFHRFPNTTWQHVFPALKDIECRSLDFRALDSEELTIKEIRTAWIRILNTFVGPPACEAGSSVP
jgi:hypothetical protein